MYQFSGGTLGLPTGSANDTPLGQIVWEDGAICNTWPQVTVLDTSLDLAATHQRPAQKDAAAEAVDQLLATLWR